jgi:hypothetical protein
MRQLQDRMPWRDSSKNGVVYGAGPGRAGPGYGGGGGVGFDNTAGWRLAQEAIHTAKPRD